MKILMPQLGETVNEGTISVWHKKVGDKVLKNEALLDVETDKAAVEVPVPEDGVLTSIIIEAGDTVDVGTVLAVIEVEGEEPDDELEPKQVAPAGGMIDKHILMPQLGETVNEGTISLWHKKIGDKVSKDEALLDVETDKAAVEVPASHDGVLSAINVEAGETVDVGTVLAVIEIEDDGSGSDSASNTEIVNSDKDGEDVSLAESSRANERSSEDSKSRHSRLGYGGSNKLGYGGSDASKKLSPAVRKISAENNIDIARIKGSGKSGRVTKKDLLAYLAGASIKSVLTPPSLTAELLPFDRIRKLTAEHMVMSKATSPHVLQTVEVNYGAVDELRRKVGPSWKAEKGYSLTYLPFIAKALVYAMGEFPRVNASIDGDALQLHATINLAIAVDLNFNGLVAPVIKDCANKSIADLAESIKLLSTKAHAGKLSPDDFANGTYTISNSGPFGTLMTAPIINQPQVAIISTDGIRKKPVVLESEQGDSIAIRPVGILAQSFDHRAFDGAYSAAFLNRVREILETHDWGSEV